MKDVIGIVNQGNSFFRRYMKQKYVHCLEAEGAQVRMIDYGTKCSDIEKIVSETDGLLLPGGMDISPELYGEERISSCGKTDRVRDQYELALLKAYMESRKPILGICRGCQMINVALGGNLYQDIVTQINRDMKKHMNFYKRGCLVHKISLVSDTLLATILDKNELEMKSETVFGGEEQQSRLGVNSMHHQAIWKLAPVLRAAAYSEDGLTEGIWMPDYPFLLGVQWHPEHLYGKGGGSKQIFEAFVRASRGKGRK